MALRDVNMVPRRVLGKRIFRRHALGWSAAAATLIAALVISHAAYVKRGSVMRPAPTSEDQVRKRLAVVIADIKAKTEDIERLAFVRQVSCPFSVSDLLSHLADVIDTKTWLTGVSITVNADGGYRLVMTGLTLSNARLGATVQALTEDARFVDVSLRSSAGVRSPPWIPDLPEEIVKFSIDANVLTE